MNRLFKTLYFFFSLILIIACSNNEEVFTEDLSIDFPTAGFTGLSEAGFANVTMTDESSMEGYTRDSYFYSNDFRTYIETPGGIGFWDIVYGDDDHVVLFAYNQNNFELSIVDRTVSANPTYDTRFTMSAQESVKINPYYYNGFIDYKSADFISKDIGWIAADYERKSNGPDQDQFPHGIRIYKVEGDNYSLLSTVEGFQLKTKAINFENELQGYVLASKDNIGYVYRTTDGGNTWEELLSFEKEPQSLFLLKDSNLLVECKYGYIQSKDGGDNWVEVDFKYEVLHTTVDENGILYSLEMRGIPGMDKYGKIGTLNISEDKGLSWEKINGGPFYGEKISFYDQNNGIAYTSDILQRTTDGGESWELLAFPIEF